MNTLQAESTSLDTVQDLINRLKQVVPQAFTEDKLDINQLKTLLGESNTAEGERYGLTWAGKSEAYKVLQTVTTSTLKPEQEKSINWNDTENVLIEGENLDVLKVLQKSYYGKVKMIYIDPPYNTGNDSFVYPDKFSETKDEYLRRIGDKDDQGTMMREGFFRKNSRENGQFHSNWLNMMLPRLALASNLLKEDGLIFVSIDDTEQANLKLLMDLVFGEENYVQEIVWQRHAGGGNDSKYFAIDHEFILCYAKNISTIQQLRLPFDEKDVAQYKFKDKHFGTLGPYKTKSFLRMRPDDPRPGLQYAIKCPDGTEIFNEWKWEKASYLAALEDDKIIIRQDDKGRWLVEYKLYLNADDGEEKQKVPRSLFLNEARNSQGKQTLTKILGKANIFNNPKPVELLKLLINLGSSPDTNDVILDFFAGSGSTAQAVMELNEESNGNRKFILVQMPEKTEESSEAYNAGYSFISDITRARIMNIIEVINKGKESILNFNKESALGFRYFVLSPSNFKIWRGDLIESEEDLIQQMKLFERPQNDLIQSYNLLWELMIKNGFGLSTPVLETKVDKSVIFHFNTLKYCFCFDPLTQNVLKEIIKLKPIKLVCLDSLFTDDCSKTNSQLKLQDNGIELKSL